MNWLAHLFLSEPTPAFRIGNLLPDLVSFTALTDLPSEYQRGIRQHRKIDAFTDAHPVFKRSVQRLGPSFRRFGGILMDVFYDHFLSRAWASYSPTPLADFTNEVYASFESRWQEIPSEAHAPLQGMREYNWLCSYGNMRDLEITLQRIGRRFRRPVDLAAAMPVLQEHYGAIHADFEEFFPILIEHVAETPPVILT
ncbi:Acyl carrier protein phosphodiesterase [Prosthecobacter debontii]|uniref:Acyl carrier protein phosphodiesterase n=1 Tax=Prosthecobacter debontii TaxID=48467 RepID=A0A1T4Z0D5_9BACT|nr:ACP phosphodiesterase [Prosthecobacter debontii]SKB07482.1 Acyl carrier protein phosphodiesterase [Prosthecobacter debontii]